MFFAADFLFVRRKIDRGRGETRGRRGGERATIGGSIVSDVIVVEATLELSAKFERFDIGAHAIGEKLQARMHVERFEQTLLERGVFAETERGEIHKRLGIAHGFEELREVGRDGAAETLFGGNEVGEGGAETEVFFFAGARFAGQGLDAREAKRMFANDLGKPDTGEALEQKVRGAVFGLLAGANDADGRDGMRRLEVGGIGGAALIETGDGEEAVRRQGLFEHLAVARLKNMERHERLRKKRHLGQRHDRNFGGKHDFHFHSAPL